METSLEVLPQYPLRATRDDLNRANLILVHKCPDPSTLWETKSRYGLYYEHYLYVKISNKKSKSMVMEVVYCSASATTMH